LPPPGEHDEPPRLADAGALLRVARDARHIDKTTNSLSNGGLSLSDLCGKPDSHDGTPRSMSALMLCNQSPTVVAEVAARLSKDDAFKAQPRGAAALLAQLVRIVRQGERALDIAPEDEPGQPGHVSIRFAAAIRAQSETIHRDVRSEIVRVFGAVADIGRLRDARCGDPQSA
jgi:hypothetical protein